MQGPTAPSGFICAHLPVASGSKSTLFIFIVEIDTVLLLMDFEMNENYQKEVGIGSSKDFKAMMRDLCITMSIGRYDKI